MTRHDRDPLALVRATGDRAEVGIRAPLGHADALTLLYAAVTADHSPLGRIVRDLLLLHQVLRGTGRPWPDCSYCHGTGQTPAVDDLGPRHCHCRCDLCTCNDPICGGPCHHVAVLLDALVLNGTPAGAVDVPRTLARLHADGVRRIVANTTPREGAVVVPVTGDPVSAQVTVGDGAAAEAIERALCLEGYQCERGPVPGPVILYNVVAIPRL